MLIRGGKGMSMEYILRKYMESREAEPFLNADHVPFGSPPSVRIDCAWAFQSLDQPQPLHMYRHIRTNSLSSTFFAYYLSEEFSSSARAGPHNLDNPTTNITSRVAASNPLSSKAQNLRCHHLLREAAVGSSASPDEEVCPRYAALADYPIELT